MTEATPRPWFYSPLHIEEGASAVRAGESLMNSWIVCTTSSDADAELIVRSVNNYDKALELLREAGEFIRQCIPEGYPYGSKKLTEKLDAFLKENSNG